MAVFTSYDKEKPQTLKKTRENTGMNDPTLN